MDKATADMSSWLVGLDAWVVQDGNYPDFITGQRTEFALEFASRRGLTPLDERHETGVRWIEGSQYEVTAQIVHDEPHAMVIDFGMLAYHFIGIEDPMHRPRTGAWVTGAINLSVDPFFYFDQLAHEPAFPALIYTWTVQEIFQAVTPESPRAGADLVRIVKTDVWADVSTSPSYLLRCRRESTPRSRVRSLGTPRDHSPSTSR